MPYIPGRYKVGPKIREYLKDNGIRESFVAKNLEISYYAFMSRMTGSVEITAEELFRICKLLGVPLETFNPDEVA